MSFNSLINYWLQAAVTQDETLEWMKRQLSGHDTAKLITEFGDFLEKTQPGDEPSLDDIESAMK